ncbi:uncharacterized protein B0H18DRAFT_989384 [Fomitopsis serialis]|uniref:uncharacterized protein n=1 Tax=Fomitopsis serialis TaxID=139415 RepID=UPI002007440A|nr:uncharacterized protein B0H18DRAFT_989384 [Neoantrodia serialis]KAH9931448.1 hypothetical protein B0H18DRAFT_989384 [Neoantrodia serialis]
MSIGDQWGKLFMGQTHEERGLSSRTPMLNERGGNFIDTASIQASQRFISEWIETRVIRILSCCPGQGPVRTLSCHRSPFRQIQRRSECWELH